MTRILAFDTSGNGFSVALLENQNVLTKKNINENSKQSELLITTIEDVLRENKIWYHDLDLIAVTQGPGSFTGVRTGLTCARTLKIATNLPLILINSLEALAFKHRQHEGEILAVIDARIEEVFVQKFRAHNGKLSVLCPPELLKVENIKEMMKTDLNTANIVICGSGKKIISENFADDLAAEEEKIEAEIVGLLALEKNPSENNDALYLRSPNITERKK